MKKTGTHTYFPILIDVRRLPCLVVGGGKVALRKVRSLLEYNASITVVSPKLCAGLTRLSKSGRISAIARPYASSFLKGHKIVFSTTDNPEVNRIVSRDCGRRGILLNVADGPSWCDLILPSSLKRGDLIVSVSSQGKAPFFTKDTKRKLEDFLSPSLSDIVKLAGEFRRRILSKGIRMSESEKKKAYGAFLTVDWGKILRKQGVKKAHLYLDRILDEVEKEPVTR